MFISRFEFHNFLSHVNSVLEFAPLTVLVGPCNAGKSAMFDALVNFSVMTRGKIALAFGEGPYSFATTLNRTVRRDAGVEFRIAIKRSPAVSSRLEYEVCYKLASPLPAAPAGTPLYEIARESLVEYTDRNVRKVLFDRQQKTVSSRLSAVRGPLLATSDSSVFAQLRRPSVEANSDDLIQYVARNISRVVKYRMYPYQLRRPSSIPEVGTAPPRIDPTGGGLSSVLFYLDQSDHPLLDKITQTLGRVVAGFKEFDFNITRDQEVGFSAVFNDGRGTVSAARVSDGTLHLIGLATLLMNPDRPRVICLEEPEIGLNSSAMEVLVTLLKDATNSRDGSQILLSTHSPFLLRLLWNNLDDPKRAIHFVRIRDGTSQVGPIGELMADNLNMPVGKDGRLSIASAAQILSGNLNDPLGI